MGLSIPWRNKAAVLKLRIKFRSFPTSFTRTLASWSRRRDSKPSRKYGRVFVVSTDLATLLFQKCWRQCTRMIYFIRFQCFVMCYISLEWYLLHCAERSFNALRKLKTCLRSTMWQQRNITLRDCARIIWRGDWKTRGGGALHKIAAKIGGLKVKSLIWRRGALSFIRNVNKIKRNKRFSIQAPW